MATLNRGSLDLVRHRLMIYGKGGPCGPMSRRRIIPRSVPARILVELHVEQRSALGMSRRTIERLVKRAARFDWARPLG